MQQITDDRLEAQVGAALLRRKWTIATAESCTGGLISHLLTNIPGSSAYVMGGVVTYSYESKVALLDVQWGTLDAHGAVSEEVAVEMARGARALFDVDLAVSVTGIAGPGGGTPEKPVGLAWFAAVVGRLPDRNEQQRADRRGHHGPDRGVRPAAAAADAGHPDRSAQRAVERVLPLPVVHALRCTGIHEGVPGRQRHPVPDTGAAFLPELLAVLDERAVHDQPRS